MRSTYQQTSIEINWKFQRRNEINVKSMGSSRINSDHSTELNSWNSNGWGWAAGFPLAQFMTWIAWRLGQKGHKIDAKQNHNFDKRMPAPASCIHHFICRLRMTTINTYIETEKTTKLLLMLFAYFGLLNSALLSSPLYNAVLMSFVFFSSNSTFVTWSTSSDGFFRFHSRLKWSGRRAVRILNSFALAIDALFCPFLSTSPPMT